MSRHNYRRVDEMSELIEKMLQEFDSGNMEAVNQILDQIDEM